jgi:hypothetical protein
MLHGSYIVNKTIANDTTLNPYHSHNLKYDNIALIIIATVIRALPALSKRSLITSSSPTFCLKNENTLSDINKI